MSILLYWQRIYWDGQRGGVMADGVLTVLATCPDLAGVDLIAIDYAPEVNLALIRPLSVSDWREMTLWERAAARACLARYRESGTGG